MPKASPTEVSLLKRSSIGGLVARVGVFLVVMSLALASAWMAKIGMAELPLKILVAVWLIVLIPVGIAIVFAELPRGTDWVMIRLGIATFCRTGLPLLIVIFVDKTIEPQLGEPAFGYLAFFYLIGFVTSVWVSVGRLGLTGSLNGVDSAVV